MTQPRSTVVVKIAPLALALAAGLTSQAQGAESFDRSKPKTDWSLCPADKSFDFYVPNFGAGVDRKTAPTDFEASSVTIIGNSHYRLEGNAIASQADQRLLADSMDYEAGSDTAKAEGNVRYQDNSIVFSADRAQSQLSSQKSALDNVRYSLVQQRGNGTATHVERNGETDSYLQTVSYSTCPPTQHDWEFKARDIHLDHVEGVGRAHGAKLSFKGVPLLYLPYARFPIDDERHSGFLYPTFGSSSRTGFDFSIPYYLNIAPNMDATLAPHLYGQRGLALDGEFRFLTVTQSGDLEGSFLPNDLDANRERFAYRYRHIGTISPHFFVTADLNRVSDRAYFQDFGNGLTASATSLLPSNAYLHGRGEWWTLEFGGDSVEITDPSVANGSEPYERLPRLTFQLDRPIFEQLHFGLDSELVRFDKADAVTATRYDFHPYLALPIERASWFVRPEVGFRATGYNLDFPSTATSNGPFSDDSPSRTVPIMSLDSGLLFDRSANWFGREFRQTLEPRAYYLRVPYRNQDELPLFDTQPLTFSFAGLFRENRFTGADRQADANQLTLAVTSRLIDDALGNEVARFAIGQTRYFDPQRVQIPGVAATDFNGSAYAAEFELRPDPKWSFAVDAQWDPETDRNTFTSLRVQHFFGDRGVINASYRYRRDQLELADLSGAFPLSSNWRLVARYEYSLRDNTVLEGLAGLEYESCCYAFRILGRHYVRNLSGESNNALFFELELKGLGSAGRQSGDFLRRAILGYR